MRHILCTLAVLLVIGTTFGQEHNDQVKLIEVNSTLRFMNAYVENLTNSMNNHELLRWIESSKSVTKELKKYCKRKYDEAKKNAELSNRFDPLFDGHAFPAKGFELESINPQTDEIILRGKDSETHQLHIQVKQVNERWVVNKVSQGK
ncbi:MAG: hypothetical protein ACK5JS_10005 [Mangrovibacterium sp.]